jgi:nucleoside 2-deoxyribosyltransferase
MRNPIVYLAGPMRGYELFNFPAFDAYRDKLEAADIDVISPADLDREVGFNPAKSLEEQEDKASKELCLMRDADAITNVDAVVLMPGWKASTGCNMEVAIALFLDKPCYQLKPL